MFAKNQQPSLHVGFLQNFRSLPPSLVISCERGDHRLTLYQTAVNQTAQALEGADQHAFQKTVLNELQRGQTMN